MMLRRFLLPFALLLAVTQASAVPRTKIGVSLPLKGEGVTYGYDILNALRFANDELFNGRYDLQVEDDGCNGSQSVAVARKFVDIEHLQYVLGLGCSSAVLSAAPIYEKARVVIISSSAASPDISNAGDYVFRTYPSSESGSALLSGLLAARHKRVGILSEQTDYAQGVAKGLKRGLAAADMEVFAEDYLPGMSDFRTLLMRMKSAKVEGLVLNPQAEGQLILMVRQLAEFGWKVPLYGFIYPGSPTFLQAVGDAAEGMVFADTPGFEDLADWKAKDLYLKFVKEYGTPKSSDFYFSTTLTAFQALDQAIRSRQDVKTYLESHQFKTIHGDFAFDKNGDPIGLGYLMKVVAGGKIKPLT